MKDSEKWGEGGYTLPVYKYMLRCIELNQIMLIKNIERV
jgi:hypothetical protein